MIRTLIQIQKKRLGSFPFNGDDVERLIEINYFKAVKELIDIALKKEQDYTKSDFQYYNSIATRTEEKIKALEDKRKELFQIYLADQEED